MKNKKREDIFTTILFFTFLIQMSVFIYINLTQHQYHLGFDASASYLKAYEIWKQKTLLISDFRETSTVCLDTPMPIAALIYGIVGNIFVAYGLANIVLGLALIWIIWGVLKSLTRQYLFYMLLAINLFLLPYCVAEFYNANDLGYYTMTFVSHAPYLLKMLILVLILKVVLNLEHYKVNWPEIIISMGLMALTVFSSSVYMLLTIMIPLYLYIAIEWFINERKTNIKWYAAGLTLFSGGGTF